MKVKVLIELDNGDLEVTEEGFELRQLGVPGPGPKQAAVLLDKAVMRAKAALFAGEA